MTLTQTSAVLIALFALLLGIWLGWMLRGSLPLREQPAAPKPASLYFRTGPSLAVPQPQPTPTA